LAAALIVIVVMTLPAGRAFSDEVEALIKKGTALRKEGRDREALEEFQRAAKIKPLPRVLAQIAFAEQALGLWVDAETHLSKALDAHDDLWISKNRSALEEALKVIKQNLATIEVWGSPEGAEVVLDGKSIGKLPAVSPVRVASDTVSMEVHCEGYLDLSRVLHVKLGGYLREHVELRPVPPVPVVKDDGSGGTGGGPNGGTIVGGSGGADGEPSESKPVYKRWWFWTAAGVVVAGAATTFLLMRRSSGSSDGCSSPTSCTTTWP
jgi:hypothetical protein